ncbi:Uncharacterised protein [Bordetella pertussis]|nr:Uncharacterised protein [Bordetella pertussis]
MSARSPISPRRIASSRFSSKCVVPASFWKQPKVAAPPLMECAARKIALSCSMSGAPTSSSSSNCSICASSSSASSKNVS